MDYKTHGVCSSMIHVELDGDKIKDVDFVGGCNGNLQGISSLVKGMKVEDAIERLAGIKWFQSDFLPGSACQSTPRSNRSVKDNLLLICKFD